jgi:hypothetical protein
MQSRVEIDERIMAVARRTGDVAHCRHLRDAGVASHHVRHRVATGWLVELLPRTYGVGPRAAEPTPVMLSHAGLLHAGPGAMLSGVSAVQALVDWARGGAVIHVAAPRTVDNVDARFRFHKIQGVETPSTIVAGDRRVMSPPNLCLELGRTMTEWQLAHVMTKLRHDRHATIEQIEELAERASRHAGVIVLRRAINLVRSGSVGTRGRTEDELLRLMIEAGFAVPTVNTRGIMGIPGDEPDFVFQGARLNVECDGGHHLEPHQAAQDEERDALAQALGWSVQRIWWEDVWRRPRAVIAAISRALEDGAPYVIMPARRDVGPAAYALSRR